MLRFLDDCSHLPVSRREWLRLGGLFGLSLLPGRVTAAEASAASTVPGFGRAKSVIVVYTSGGQSQLDSWDPKPQAPAEVRGKFDTIRTAVPGTFVAECLPKLAAMSDRYAICRSISHDDVDHGSAIYLALTGRPHPQKSSNPPIRPTDFPSLGAALERVRPDDRFPHAAMHVNGPMQVPRLIPPGQFGGFLGKEYDAPVIGDVTTQDIALPGLRAQPELPPVRISRRRKLLAALDQHARELEAQPAMRKTTELYRQAFEILGDRGYRQAFDLSQEKPELRDRYGRNRSGQACLLARRLAEVGVPLIGVIWNHSNRGQDLQPDNPEIYGWDTHNDIWKVLGHLMPRFDQSFSTLLEDLEDRGLLEETLVVCMGEFGRAPLIALEPTFKGNDPGRKHWASVYSVLFAGAGVQPGLVLGASDKLAAHPVTQPYGPWDIAATVFHALGIDPARHYHDRLDRPFPLSIGQPMTGLYG